MILHDQIRLYLEEDTGEKDAYGKPIYDWVDYGNVPADVRALEPADAVEGERVISRYRVTLSADVPIPSNIGDHLEIGWADLILHVDGTVERHMFGGRLHHYEFTSEAVHPGG